mmetsp:Transcript_137744/g.239511  ORF Transcript_137744/g.239511 Transcript_137744/m.239511 type:complete len:349 (-) Transcript_137744:2594-3640(-)
MATGPARAPGRRFGAGTLGTTTDWAPRAILRSIHSRSKRRTASFWRCKNSRRRIASQCPRNPRTIRWIVSAANLSWSRRRRVAMPRPRAWITTIISTWCASCVQRLSHASCRPMCPRHTRCRMIAAVVRCASCRLARPFRFSWMSSASRCRRSRSSSSRRASASCARLCRTISSCRASSSASQINSAWRRSRASAASRSTSCFSFATRVDAFSAARRSCRRRFVVQSASSTSNCSRCAFSVCCSSSAAARSAFSLFSSRSASSLIAATFAFSALAQMRRLCACWVSFSTASRYFCSRTRRSALRASCSRRSASKRASWAARRCSSAWYMRDVVWSARPLRVFRSRRTQ